MVENSAEVNEPPTNDAYIEIDGALDEGKRD